MQCYRLVQCLRLAGEFAEPRRALKQLPGLGAFPGLNALSGLGSGLAGLTGLGGATSALPSLGSLSGLANPAGGLANPAGSALPGTGSSLPSTAGGGTLPAIGSLGNSGAVLPTIPVLPALPPKPSFTPTGLTVNLPSFPGSSALYSGLGALSGLGGKRRLLNTATGMLACRVCNISHG